MHCITSGVSKDDTKPVTITTWQSVFRLHQKWYDQFGVALIDEAHLAKAQSLTGMMTKMVNCEYRFGFTGSLDGTLTHALVIQGLLGPIKRVATTKELITQQHLANFRIKAIVLKYDEVTCKAVTSMSYADEKDFIVRNEARNRFIRNLAISLKGNSLLLFQYVDKHGQMLYNALKEVVKDRPIFFIHGGVEGDERERVRGLIETHRDAIVVASVGVFSTGVNIRNLHNVIFTSPSKSKIRTLQSIGRTLRLSENKDVATLYDIADDLSYKSKKNYTLLHFAERVKLYNEEQFLYKLYNVQLKA